MIDIFSDTKFLLSNPSNLSSYSDLCCRIQKENYQYDLLRFCISTKVEKFIAGVLIDSNFDFPVIDEWHRIYLENQIKLQKMDEVITVVFDFLSSHNIRAFLFESSGVFYSKSDIPLNYYGANDFDLYIPTEYIEFATDFLSNIGGKLIKRDGRFETSRKEFFFECDKVSFFIDITDVLFEKGRGPFRFHNLLPDIINRLEKSPRNSSVYIPNCNDLFVQVSIHTTLHTFFRSPGLRLFLDLSMIIANVSWIDSVLTANKLGLKKRFLYSINFYHSSFGLKIPKSLKFSKYNVFSFLVNKYCTFRISNPFKFHFDKLFLLFFEVLILETRFYSIFRRVLDLGLSIIMILLLSPIFALICLLIIVLDKHSPIFIQKRIGNGCKIFDLYKFKTMSDSSTKDWYLTDSQRLTNLGSFLRKTSLDELPQLINIVKGDLSFVGPRPLLVSYLARYSNIELHRHDVQPGITGLAQVSGRQSSLFSDRIKNDLKYILNQSLGLDFGIIIRTILMVFSSKNVILNGQNVDDVDDLGLSHHLSKKNMDAIYEDICK